MFHVPVYISLLLFIMAAMLLKFVSSNSLIFMLNELTNTSVECPNGLDCKRLLYVLFLQVLFCLPSISLRIGERFLAPLFGSPLILICS